jgi:uncharacterized protein (DUF2236 family)
MPEPGSEYRFSPNSPVGKIHREAALGLWGAPPALLTQAARPEVAQGAVDGNFRREPLTRLTGILIATDKIVFGRDETRTHVAENINEAHRGSAGTLDHTVGSHHKGERYRATDPRLLKWVGAVVLDTAVTVTNTFIRRLLPEEIEAYYAQARTIFEPIGLSREDMPETYTGLQRYMQKQIASGDVAVSPHALETIAPVVLFHEPLQLPHLPFRIKLERPALPLIKATVGLMDEELRDQYHLSWTKADQRMFDAAAATSRAIYQTVGPVMPDVLRFSPASRKAAKVHKQQASTSMAA